MQLIVHKSQLAGKVAVPASKSHTIRAVAIASLAEGASILKNPLVSADTQAAVDCYRSLGADIVTTNPRQWTVKGTSGIIRSHEQTIDVCNSGTTLRLAMGSAALAEQARTTTFTGDAQIRNRSVAPLMASLNELGAKCVSLRNNGKAPVKVTGRLKGGKTSIAAISSQYLSSLLLCTPLAERDTEIDVTLLNEPGYVRMTFDWLDKQRIEYENLHFKKIRMRGKQHYKGFDITIPADFSSATFFLCAAALVADELTLTGLDFSDSQPDKAVVDYLKAMGADIMVGGNLVTVKAAPLKGIEIDINSTPDALPAMAVTAAFAEGTTKLLNVPQARGKETDRIACMAQELKKMGIDAEELPDGLIVHHGKPRAARLDGRCDHRIVMALSIAGLAADGDYTIDTAEAMSVTCPRYVELMRSVGANMSLCD